ncbi:hypothetical protein M2459_001558 [Parabacteroides sp. PF5-5]|uniref:DUF3990 domain-containing protein n=1 Tax=unclassified Parabacteroides TaxID=2649774 RepID=UPI0024763D97|nr:MULTISPECIES: DUF3990 domain-containing protein [unclassified Parabacteroides]MDH6304822.1 hypothetical protein [Parabacteroides sp. PH5-39]MDH6315564.1 hypothetical protein [Parabacteroides sp. PF5-13]MDH6319224.1 hypothetical protein [Parabacteroides sp. PH5-13]MDH6322955.1 hypothetical protein [Parabacteroides sp. PH5-8]MDH6326757.1 hypothetical protein [Parabacteroides sp. PH5-41]
MILYHGSNTRIESISLEKCLPYKDFGRGFYLTDMEEQALRMAERIARIRGGEPIVNIYDFDEANLTDGSLSVKVFDKPSEEWATFVMANRDRKAIHPIHAYDIVIGPVANDTMATQFRIFEDGYIDISELTRRLEYKEFTRQLFFATGKAIKLLKPL